MTTIAYRDGVLAADGRSVGANDVILGDNTIKVWTLPNGFLVGGSGTRSVIFRYRDWMASREGARPSLRDGDKDNNRSMIIEIMPNGTIYMHEDEYIHDLTEPFVAIGSGREAAMAAMHMGAGAEEAIRIACKTNPWSGGVIHKVQIT